MISTHVKSMMNLKQLHFDDNQLTKMPDEVFNLRLLEELTVSHNRLQEISPRISNLNTLYVLHLNDN
jgi:Leucine-rich repeat (LRR) protein